MRFHTFIRVLFVILSILIGLATCSLIGGCEILKTKKSSSVDSTSLTKKTEISNSDETGGHISKDESKSKGEYERTTFIYPPRDTNIYNFYNQPPSTVIYEKGKTEQASTKTDSGWYKMLEQQVKSLTDSISSSRKENSKDVQKETKGVGLIAVILIIVGGLIVYEVIRWQLGKFQIVKRN